MNAFAENSSQIYFPFWIYDRIYQRDDIELGDATQDLMKLVRKMTLVALWFIQMKPVDCPSISQVLDMLEGEVELIQMPPKPSFHLKITRLWISGHRLNPIIVSTQLARQVEFST